MKLVTTDQMRELEHVAVKAGATWPGLMEHAGWGVAQQATQVLGAAHGRRVAVLVGPGNNGGDGLVAARHLHDAGAYVTLYLWRRTEREDDLNLQRCRTRDISVLRAEDDTDLRDLRRLLTNADLIIDALLGMGTTRPVTGTLAAIIACVHEATPGTRPPVVLAIDIPTGINSDTGTVLGVAVRADVTVATGQIKRGTCYYPGRSFVGAIRLADIGLSSAQLEAIMSELISVEQARTLLPARPDDSHKGTYGKAMIVAGSLLYPGAATLASAGALRVGAGLVTLATGRSVVGVPGRLPEVTLRPLPEVGWGTLGAEAADELLKHLGDYDALLIGPGLGREKETRAFLERLLGIETPRQRGQIGFRISSGDEKPSETKRPDLPTTVLDADALNLLSEIAEARESIQQADSTESASSTVEHWWTRMPKGRCVLTPHPGEMKRLLNGAELGADLAQVAADAATQWGQIVVLKGATTIIADPEGRTVLNDGGNAALATAGTGDVLAGAIAGLAAQGLAPFDAAVLGVYLHSAAGRLVREELGDMGTIASDLLPRLPLAIKSVRG